MNASYGGPGPSSRTQQLPQTWVNYYGAAPLADFEEAEDVTKEDFYSAPEAASWEQPFPSLPQPQQPYNAAKLSSSKSSWVSSLFFMLFFTVTKLLQATASPLSSALWRN